MKYLTINIYVVLIFILTLFSCNSEKKNNPISVESENTIENIDKVESKQDNEDNLFELISEQRKGILININLFIQEKDFTKQEILDLAEKAKLKYCKNNNCNVINCWNSKISYEQYYDERTVNEEPNWMKKNWVGISEGLLFEYNVYVDEVIVYPFLDGLYRDYGGKKKRPN